jgi:cobalt transporter subunit CbtB
MTKDTNKVKAILQTRPTVHDQVAEVWPALAAVLLGTFILYGVGFAGADVLHNVAHDSRHAITFPCH